jgi:putative ABC transport system permease protein
VPFGIRAGVRRLLNLPPRSPASIRDAMDEELRFYLDARIDQLVSRGVPRAEAEAETLARLSESLHETRTRLHHSAERRERHMRIQDRIDETLHDLRYAGRGLVRSKGFTAAVVVTLGLGIGANAAMFGVVDRLLFRPPDFLRDPANVNRVYLARTIDGVERIDSNIQFRRYRELSDWTSSVDRTAGFFEWETAVGEGDDVHQLPVQGVSASYFSFFDIRPVIGRFFTSAEDSVSAEAAVAVLGYDYWQSRFGGREDAVGKVVRIGATPFEIVGVAPRGFAGMEMQPPVAFVPLTRMGWEFGSRDRSMYHTTFNMSWMEMMVHRRPNVSLPVATVDLTTAYQRSHAEEAEMRQRPVRIERERPRAIVASVLAERGPNAGSESRVALWLMGVTGIVLLIACANVANLLLARGVSRRREIAVRLALGVSRGRLLRQLFTESLLLAGAGGVAGLLVAQWGGQLMKALFLPQVEWAGSLSDGRTVWFTGLATLLAALLAGLAPALHARRGDVTESLKTGVREGTFHRSRMRTALMVAQGALSVILLVGAGLFVRSLHNVHGLRLGYDPDRLIYVRVDARSTPLTPDEQAVLKARMRDAAAALPGVENAARAVTVPFWQRINVDLFVPGVDSVGRLGVFSLQAVSPEYFATMGTRLLRGRGIERTDVAGAQRAIVVSDAMARALWPGQDAMGKCVRVNADTVPCAYVVGIAENIRRESLADDPSLQFYVPIEQWERGNGGLFVRTRGDATTRAEGVRRALQQLMPGDAFVTARPMEEILDPVVRSWRLGATMFVAFGGLALVLATIGLYSLIAYGVVQRMHELGVRVALGARGNDVVRLVVGQGIRLTLAGVAIGGGVALWAGRFVKPLLFDESARDPVVFAIVTVSLLGAALLACIVPALRATRVDPVTALRAE